MMRIPRRDFIRAGLGVAALAGCTRNWAQQLVDHAPPVRKEDTGWAQLPSILAGIVPPTFPDADFFVTDYGASPGLDTDCFAAFAAAIQACNQAGGGRVVVTAGDYLSNGPIHLLSSVELHLEANATIFFGVDPANYLPPVLVRWSGYRCYNYSPLIYAYQQRNIAITGSGTFNGQGFPTWDDWTIKETPDYTLLQAMAADGIPLEDRVFGAGHYLRPAMFEPYDCRNILVKGVSFAGSPFWTMHPTFCNNVTIEDVTVLPGAQNDDGCDPDSCMDVLVTGCSFTTTDDNVSIKAGANPDALGLPECRNIVIQNCNLLRSTFSGLTMGSNTSGFIRNVFMENCTVDNCIAAHYIKSHANLGGGVENLYIRNNKVLNCHHLILLQPDEYDEAGTFGPPLLSNINMQDVTCLKASVSAFYFEGDPRMPIDGVNLQNIAIKSTDLLERIVSTKNLVATGITVDGKPVAVTG
jgi:polygalacturonase